MDASCLVSLPDFDKMQNQLYDLWTSEDSITIQQAIRDLSDAHLPGVLGQHYFVTNPVTGSGVSPKWDFTSARFAGNADAFMVGQVNGSLASPDDASKDVTWLHVVNVEGDLADVSYRYDTVGGQPPISVSLLHFVADAEWTPGC